MNLLRAAAAALAVCVVLGAQTAPPRLEFEVASIKPSAQPPIPQVSIGVRIDGAQVNCTYLSLKDYIRMAYRVKDYQITGPDFLASERFDISAKLPSGATREQVPAMLQTLLEDRFQVRLHRDSKEFPVYGLVVAKGGLKINPSVPDPDDGSEAAKNVNVSATGGRGGTSINFGKGSYFNFGDNKLEGKRLTMASLAETLARFVERPVVDMTGLKDTYDFKLEVTPEDFRSMMIRAGVNAGVNLPPEALRLLEGASNDSLFAALQGLGLRLEPRKAPLEVLVIDHAEKTPSAN